LEIVPEQPGLQAGVAGRIGLLHLIVPIFDSARELDLVVTVADADAARLALRLRVGLAVDQRADLRVSPEVPASVGPERHAGRMCETRRRVDVLVALLDVHTAAVGQAFLHPRNQRPLTLEHAGLPELVLERVVEVQGRMIRDQVVGAELATRPEIALGRFRIDSQRVADAIRSTDTRTSVVVPVTAL